MVIAQSMMKGTGMIAPKRSEGERSEAERSAGASIPESATAPADPEVSTKATRRKFKAAYKLRILREADEGGPVRIPVKLSTQSRDVVHPPERSDAGVYNSGLSGQHQSRKSNLRIRHIISFLVFGPET